MPVRREDEGLKRLSGRGIIRLIWVILAALLLTGCGARPSATDGATPSNGTIPTDGARVLLDGAVWDGRPVSANAAGPRVYVTLDGRALIDLPFSEARTVTVIQQNGAENAVALTGDAVYMAHANCDNRDCVDMGRVTLDNLETRVMGGFIVCLPHKVSVELRE